MVLQTTVSQAIVKRGGLRAHRVITASHEPNVNPIDCDSLDLVVYLRSDKWEAMKQRALYALVCLLFTSACLPMSL
jgi:hypothetical protein